MQLTSRRPRELGFSIVELLVGLVAGLFIVLSMTGLYLNSYRGANDSANANRLNQDLRAVMDILVADLRRAGYAEGLAAGTANPFTAATTDVAISGAGNSCLLYSYDATYLAGNTAGTPDAGADFFGFRLNAGAVQSVVPGTGMSDTSAACTTLTWENLTEPGVINVTALSFDTGSSDPNILGSQCTAFDPQTYNAAASSTYAWWQVNTSPSASKACVATAPGAPASYPAAGQTFVETRRIRVTLSAQLVSDASLSRTLTETVMVRNNRVIRP